MFKRLKESCLKIKQILANIYIKKVNRFRCYVRMSLGKTQPNPLTFKSLSLINSPLLKNVPFIL